MIISIWRYSHLTLAISSFIFILIASITGIILAFEPIVEQVKPYGSETSKFNLAQTITILQEEYDEVITIERDHNDFIIASVITKEGADERFYIDPATGEKVGDLIEKAPIFKFSTNLHRSLFLKSTGRAIIGIISFLLFLIAVTGLILIVKRQGGTTKIFTKVIKEETEQYYHVILGRYAFIPIVILTLTGVYLSLEKFSLLPEYEISHDIQFPETPQEKLDIKDFELFQNISLSEIKKVEFPFSDDPEDYFLVDLKSKELIVDQFSGKVLSEIEHPFVVLASTLSMNLHTGRGSIVWSIIILLATTSILYFIYSGFAMTIKRRKKSSFITQNIFSKDEAEFVIVVGSETGSTYKPAKLIFDAIRNLGKKVFISEMNQVSEFNKMKHLLVLTSTYGTGEAPNNANNFLSKLSELELKNPVDYSVVGFGSLAYPDFCEFAIDVDASLQQQANFTPATPLYKIHNQSFVDIHRWAKEWSENVGLSIQLSEEDQKISLPKQQEFTVLERTELNQDDTFLLQLKPKRRTSFQSGDLLVFYPEEDSVARYYSIGKRNQNILLSIKKHDLGVASCYFSKLRPGDQIKAVIQKNSAFHISKKAEEIILVSNGTGIAPYLGMIEENRPNQKIHLFWGGRKKESFGLYEQIVQQAQNKHQLQTVCLAFSRENDQKEYVQDLLNDQSDLVSNVLAKKGNIMICGSLAMEKGVLSTLERITKNKLQTDFEQVREHIQSDCY